MNGKLICTRGYPASGKTTWAVVDHWKDVLVSRDDIRRWAFGREGKGILSPEQEDAVTRIQREIVKGALDEGKTVVVHDTNLRSKYLHEFARMATDAGAGFEVVDFPVSEDECITRDSLRSTPVGEDVIRKLAKRFPMALWPDIPFPALTYRSLPKYEPDVNLRRAFIFDVDGTLARMNGRGPYDSHLAHTDEPVDPVAMVAGSLYAAGGDIVVMSGRKEKDRRVTEDWLDRYMPFQRVGPFMRPTNDVRPDWLVKYELFMKHVAPNWRVMGAVDDRLQVARMWHHIGVPLFRVGDPDADY